MIETFSLCGDVMKRIIVFTLVLLCGAAVANTEIYTWTDDQGVVTFTDNPDRLSSRYSSKAQREENVIIRPPTVQKKIRKQGTKKLQATVPRNRIKSIVARAKPTTTSQRKLQPSKEPLGGDQVDPAPPGIHQPPPEPPSDQSTSNLKGLQSDMGTEDSPSGEF